MRTIRHLAHLLILTAALVALAACSTSAPGSAPTVKSENTTGAYTVPAGSQWYQTLGGVLYAFDGTDWYALRQAENNAGYVGGVNVGAAERWVKAGGSETQGYRRTPQTFRDTSIRPVFLAY